MTVTWLESDSGMTVTRLLSDWWGVCGQLVALSSSDGESTSGQDGMREFLINTDICLHINTWAGRLLSACHFFSLGWVHCSLWCSHVHLCSLSCKMCSNLCITVYCDVVNVQPRIWFVWWDKQGIFSVFASKEDQRLVVLKHWGNAEQQQNNQCYCGYTQWKSTQESWCFMPSQPVQLYQGSPSGRRWNDFLISLKQNEAPPPRSAGAESAQGS